MTPTSLAHFKLRFPVNASPEYVASLTEILRADILQTFHPLCLENEVVIRHGVVGDEDEFDVNVTMAYELFHDMVLPRKAIDELLTKYDKKAKYFISWLPFK